VNLNTLVDYRYTRRVVGQRGVYGGSKVCTGAKGDDQILPVPVGTTVMVGTSQDISVGLSDPGKRLLGAEGGWPGGG
ncbi:GTPase ObgE, partial [Pseudomonas aeruginosa]